MDGIPFPNQAFLVCSGSPLLNEAERRYEAGGHSHAQIDFNQIFEFMSVGGVRDRGSNSEYSIPSESHQ